MLDPNKRHALVEKLRGRMKSANVSMKVEAVNGDYKIVLLSDRLEQYYRDAHVGTIRTAELDEEAIQLINEDAKEAASIALEEFAAVYTPPKTAANKVVTDETAQMVTQKQLEDQKTKLHPRTDESAIKITDKQLVDAGQRPGTYDQTTEAQLQSTDNTFYGKELVHDPKDEDRNRVTESQFEEGTKEFSDKGVSDRDRMGAEFSGGLDKQHVMIGEKQIGELLSHHEWIEPKTTTEGKDQLGKQDGELARLASDQAAKLLKEAADCLGRTVIAGGVTPDQVAETIKRLLSHPSKHPVVANVLNILSKAGINDINDRLAKASYFGKFANTSANITQNVIASMALRQLAQLGVDARHTVRALAKLSSRDDFISRIHAAAETAITSPVKTATSEKTDEFDEAFASENKPIVQGSADDGLYMFRGKIAEVDEKFVSQYEEKSFAKAASVYGAAQINKSAEIAVELVPQTLKVNRKDGSFDITYKDASSMTEEELQKRAEKRREMAKTAAKTAQFGGPAGGTPMPGNGSMQNPATPPGGADMGAPPPTEALGGPPVPPEEEKEGTGGEPQPPGTICPSCGSNDVDLESGEWECKNCGAKGDVSFHMTIKEAPGVLESSESKDEAGADIEEGLEPEGGTPPGEIETEENLGPAPTPVGASVRVTPALLEKLASQKINFGEVCPRCGSHNTDLSKNASKGYNGICWKCNNEWKMKIFADKKDSKKIYAQWVWIPEDRKGCNTCTRLSSTFRKALDDYGMKWADFDKMAMVDKGALVVKMAKAGVLSLGESLMSPLPLKKYAASSRWEGYGRFDKFPKASCIERIARKYGENATALSGPCEGKQLADCLCNQLANLGIYTDGLAAKVASSYVNEDPMEREPSETCTHMLVKAGFGVKEACVACDGLRAAYATPEDLIIEAVSQLSPVPQKMSPPPMTAPKPPAPMKSSPAAMKPAPMPGAGNAISAQPAPQPAPAPAAPAAMPGAGAAPGMAPAAMPGAAPAAMPGAKGMEGSPMDVPSGAPSDLMIEVESDPNGLGDPTAEDGLMSGNMDIDMGGDMVQIEVPAQFAQLLQTVVDALKGTLGESAFIGDEESGLGDEPGDELGDHEEPDGDEPDLDGGLDGDDKPEGDKDGDMLDVSDVTEEVVDDGAPSPDISFESEDKDKGEKDESGPPKDKGSDEEPDKGDFMGKESASKPCMQPAEMKSDAKPCGCKKGKACRCSETQSTVKSADLDRDLYRMKRGTISKTADAIDNLLDGLIRIADKVKAKPVQDDPDVKPYSGDSTIGNEDKFSADDPKVPEGDANLPGEDYEKVNAEKNAPEIPTGKGKLKGEEGLHKPEKTDIVDGNQGQPHTSSSKNTKKVANQNKESGAKSTKVVKSLEDDPDIGKVKSDQTHSLAETEKKPSEGVSEPKVPEAPDGGRLSREHTVEKPKGTATVPSEGKLGRDEENEKNLPEKVDEVMGRANDAQALASHHSRAQKVAGLMAKAGLISIDELFEKAEELKNASTKVLNDYEHMITAGKGLQKEASVEATENLTAQSNVDTGTKVSSIQEIRGLFTLDRLNREHEARE